MAVRPTWRGNLRLALVSCPIRLSPATTDKEKIRFHKLSRESGNRLRQQMIDPESGEPVGSDETVMGYEFEKGRYVTVEKKELDELKIESSDTINIERVVPASDVEPLYWDSPYLVEPDGKSGVDIFATLRDALTEKNVVGLGRMVLARRERPVMIQPRGKGMMIVTLRDPDEVKQPEKIFDMDIKDVKVDKQLLSMAETLLERMEGKFDVRGPLSGCREGPRRGQDERQEASRRRTARAHLECRRFVRRAQGEPRSEGRQQDGSQAQREAGCEKRQNQVQGSKASLIHLSRWICRAAPLR